VVVNNRRSMVDKSRRREMGRGRGVESREVHSGSVIGTWVAMAGGQHYVHVYTQIRALYMNIYIQRESERAHTVLHS
jgi:hypothetical protein